ncbi:MAG: hypothetical protein GC190_17950 [Alphaproteobacteria bacterium]|nr:hypothetical protein [Alphaproteobacteria bacterium]
MVEKRSGRADRLAAALRDNLKRRKAQARAKAAGPDERSALERPEQQKAAPEAAKPPKNR